jgi:hypothetical protein
MVLFCSIRFTSNRDRLVVHHLLGPIVIDRSPLIVFDLDGPIILGMHVPQVIAFRIIYRDLIIPAAVLIGPERAHHLLPVNPPKRCGPLEIS